MDIIAIILFGLLFVVSILSLGYVGMTAPIAFPYIVTKLKRGALLILKTDTGNYRLVPVDESYNSKKYGSFIPNSAALMKIAGVNMAFGSTKMAVIPTREACIAAEKLHKAKIEPKNDIMETADTACIRGTLEKVDLDAIYEYTKNISPNFVEKRIAIRTAELLANYRKDDMMKYVVMFVMILIAGGIAIYMIKSGAGGSVANAVSSAASVNI